MTRSSKSSFLRIMRTTLTIVIVVFSALTLSTAARAATITVTTLSDPAGPSGTCSLRDAITAANTMTATNGCAAGSGNDTINFSVTGTIALASTLPQITGASLTITGPASPGIKIDGGGAVQVMVIASGANVHLSHLTISNGMAIEGGGIFNEGTLTVASDVFSGNSTDESGFNGGGGGIANTGNLTVISSTFSGNNGYTTFNGLSRVGGGAISNAGNLTVTASTFSGNNAFDGGGINSTGALTIANCTFSGNKAHFNGGAIRNYGGTLVISNSRFSGGEAGDDGGGIQNIGIMTVSSSTFFNNIASILSEGGGGAIANYGIASVTNSITNSTFSLNSSEDGGGILNNSYELDITNSTFSANDGGTQGGGIWNQGALTVKNSTFSNNSTSFGGGGIWNQGSATVINSTFSGNSGSGIGSYDYGISQSLIVTNSTFSANSDGGVSVALINRTSAAKFKGTILGGNIGGNCSGSITDAGYNISDDASCAFSATGSHNNTDPKFDTAGLANNGGPTKTIALQSTSPAIDAIPLANCTDQASPPNPIITDQRLFPRPDAGESKCDIGAFEVQDKAFVPFTSFNGSVTIDPDAGVFALLGGFTVRNGVTINPLTQPVAFGIGSYAIRLPAGSFTRFSNGYVYKKTVNGVSLRINIQFTRVPTAYTFQAYRSGGTIDSSTSPLPATLTIGNNVGTKQMKATYY